MAQMQPMLELPAATPHSRSRRTRLPGWLVLLLGSPKARVGLGIVLGMVLLGLLAPLLVPASKATEFSLLDARQAPSLHHVFGTSDQGTDVFAQVAWGARRSLLLGAAAAVVAALEIRPTLGEYCSERLDSRRNCNRPEWTANYLHRRD